MFIFQRGNLETPGQWEPGMQGKEKRKRIALVSCPQCGKGMSLSGHQVASDGFVTPSLVCSHGCGFHTNVRLDGWMCEDNQQGPAEPKGPPEGQGGEVPS